MKLIINGILISSKVIQKKKGGDLQINQILDSSGGILTLLGDTIRIDPNAKKMVPCVINADVEVSNYNGVSFIIQTFSAEGLKA